MLETKLNIFLQGSFSKLTYMGIGKIAINPIL